MREHFQLNLDKEFFMGNDRTIKVIESIFAKKVSRDTHLITLKGCTQSFII